MKKTIKIRIFKISLIIIFVLLFLICSEFILRKFSPLPIFSPYLDYPPYKIISFKSNLNGITSPTTFSTNKWGFRGIDPPKDWDNYHTIITIGGSTTQCLFLDDSKAWPFILEKELTEKKNSKFWVGNAGIDGHSSTGHLFVMKEVILKIKPKTVIMLVGTNDLACSLTGEIYKPEKIFLKKLNKKGICYFLFSNLKILQILNLWKEIVFNRNVVISKEVDWNFIPKKLETETLLPEDLRKILPSLKTFRLNIEDIIQLSKENNIRIIFLTQPSVYSDNKFWLNKETPIFWIPKQKYHISGNTKFKLLTIFNNELIKICKENNVEHFDLASNIPHNFEYFYDDVHFNDKGSILVGKEVANYMIKTMEKTDTK
ncbi:SGNH/GDSL hydrolase family protein [Candidatus Dependentiae bacterium]|nr:SGNH/GDSL hydrolase family protein [Candidatus Dependentiae bacterium]